MTLKERAQEVLNKKAILDNWETVKDKMEITRPSLKNIDRRIGHGRPHAIDPAKRESWEDIPDWRRRTREDNLALRLQGRNKVNQLRQRQMSEQIQKLDTGEIPASRIGQNNLESENVHVQTLQEILGVVGKLKVNNTSSK